jgi:hypothetical protein
VDYEYSSTCKLLFCPSLLWLSSHPLSSHECHSQFHFLCCRLCSIWFHSPATVNFFFVRLSYKSGWEEIVNEKFVTSAFYFPSQFCHCSMCSCHVLCLTLFSVDE